MFTWSGDLVDVDNTGLEDDTIFVDTEAWENQLMEILENEPETSYMEDHLSVSHDITGLETLQDLG